MDSIDDDFGELYADVEVQVKTITNNVPEFTKFYTELEPEPEPEDNDNSNENTNSQKTPSLEGDDGSDSEDELKIVLNDEDCKRFPVTGGGGGGSGGGFNEDDDGFDQVVGDGLELNSNNDNYNNNNGHSYNPQQHLQYKYIRPHGSNFPSNLRVNGSTGTASFSSMSARGDRKVNACNQHKGSISGKAASIGAISKVHQRTYSFSLPWYRTILDVNIDTFEEKPWNHPEANMSDFFNFDFNEESWKSYRSVLGQFQHCTLKQSRNAVCESPKLNQPKGQAIEVEGSIGERQPSMDVKRPRIQDSDVVIQINVQDCTEDFSWSGKEELGHIDSNSSDPETSKNGDLDLDHNRGVPCCGSASGDEVSADSLEKDDRNSDLSSALRRVSEPKCASNPTSPGFDDHGNGQISDGDGHRHQNLNVCTPERTSKAMETLKREEGVDGRKAHDSDLCLETELSLADRSHFTLSPSCSGNDSDVSKNSFHSAVRVCGPSTRQYPNSGIEVISDKKDFISNDINMKPGHRRYHLKRRSPYQEDWKRHSRRCRGVTMQNIYPKTDDDASPLSDGKDDGKDYLRHGPVREKWKNCHGIRDLRDSASEHKFHPENGYDTGREGSYNRDYKSVRRRKQRLNDLDYHGTEDFSYNREVGFSSGYGSEKFGDNHIKFVQQKYPHGKYRQHFGDWTDPYSRSKWDEREYRHERSARDERDYFHERSAWDEREYCHERSARDERDYFHERSARDEREYCLERSARDEREYCHERSTRVDNEDDMGRDQYYCKRGDGESRLFVPKYSSSSTFKESDSLDFEENDFVQEKFGRSVSFTERERDYMDTMYERDLPFIGREVKISVQRGRYGDSHCLDLDRSWSMENENEYGRCLEHQSSTNRSCRERFTDNRRRRHDSITSIDDAYDSKLTERYRRHRRHIGDEEHRDIDSSGIYNVTDGTEYSIWDNNDQDHDHLQRRRHSWHSTELHRMEDELIARDWDSELFAEKFSFSYEETSTSERIDPEYEYESGHDGMLLDDMHLEHHRYKSIREGSSAKCGNKNYNIIYRGEHEHTVLRCRDSVDWIVGEEKSSGRWSKGRSLMCSGKVEKIDQKLAKEQTTLKDYHESDRGRAIRTDIARIDSNKNNEKRRGKFPVTACEDLDIAEGQIVAEEPNMEKDLEKKHVSESTAPTRNVKKRISHSENASSENNIVEQYDNQHLQETLAKMEKRRERFKDLVPLKKEPDKNPKPQADLLVDTAETKQLRPARKRRWNKS
ncbi:hypothetical protein LWI29_029502 [Acer saccharum]|uniref:Pre-mRNA polyadenylation factor Fip1 domain-containing protein n=1 Tax=Acer saccharum TaxID=4024 RepID=A0AA39TWU2_ACESA|nr:hypothetical protein LWI29_029502 [Acer saccharum]